MEHVCRECDEQWFDNKARPPCPNCGSYDAAHYFDEEPECYRDDYYDYEPDYDEEDE
jgi:hypothetical protein